MKISQKTKKAMLVKSIERYCIFNTEKCQNLVSDMQMQLSHPPVCMCVRVCVNQSHTHSSGCELQKTTCVVDENMHQHYSLTID